MCLSGTQVYLYASYWPQEYFRVYVDDTGVIGFYWWLPMQIGEAISSNVALLPFEEIQEIVRKDIVRNVKGMWDGDLSIIQRRFVINRMVLGLTKIKQKSGGYILTPTWSLFGYEVDKYNAPQPGGYILNDNNEYKEEAVGRSFLTINAIDGSIIDPALGY